MPNFLRGVSIIDLCWVFCCPPFPRSITEKIAFMPPVPTYEVAPTKSETIQYAFHLSPDYDTSGLRKVIQQEVRVVKTTLSNSIVVLYVKGTTSKTFTILYSHGNAVDVGLIHRLCVDLSQITGCDVVTYDYSGYGQSTGSPSEKNLYADIKAAWDYTLTFQEPDPSLIILYGHSLGAAATIDLASKVECAGVILHAPFASSFQVVCPKRPWFPSLDTLKSIEKIPKVTSPVLVIHGTNDEIIDFSHGQAIYERCPRAVEPLWVEGAGHNDIELYGQYVERLCKFINEELVT